jgi:hypothetical protein
MHVLSCDFPKKNDLELLERTQVLTISINLRRSKTKNENSFCFSLNNSNTNYNININNKMSSNNNIMKDDSVAQVASWISSLGIPSHTFVENDVDGDLLFSLSALDLQNLGLTPVQAKLLHTKLGQTKFSSYNEQTERTLEYLQQENDDLARDNQVLEKRNAALETELNRLRMLVYYTAGASSSSARRYPKTTTTTSTVPETTALKKQRRTVVTVEQDVCCQ